MPKLVFELQACSQRIHKASMLRFRSSIDLDDIILIKQTISRDGVFHETPHQLPPSMNQKANAQQAFPMLQNLSELCLNSLYLVSGLNKCLVDEVRTTQIG